MSIQVMVYGSLKTGNRQTTLVRGKMVNLGSFPAIKLDPNGDLIEVEIANITEQQLSEWDRYEGYDPITHTGLYLRNKITSEDGIRGYIYEFADWDSVKTMPKVEPQDGIVSWTSNYQSIYANTLIQCAVCGVTPEEIDSEFYNIQFGLQIYTLCEDCFEQLQKNME